MADLISSRLSTLIKYLISSNQVHNQRVFCDRIKIGTREISSMVNGKRNISERTIRKIANTFPEVNANWLLTGEGEMLKSEQAAAAPAAGSAASTPPMGDDIRKLRDEISRLSGEVAELRKVILAQNSQLIELLKSEKSR